MQGIKRLGAALTAVLAISAMASASASAVQWNPQNTVVGPATGRVTMSTNRGGRSRAHSVTTPGFGRGRHDDRLAG
jgi:hypothetical protein